jgi:hypothetical protein
VQWAKASAGARSGTAGTKSGNAYLTWALAEAAGLVLRTPARGQPCLARLANKHGKGHALTVLAHTRARALYDRVRRDPVFEMETFLPGSGRSAGAPAASRATPGSSLHARPGPSQQARRHGTRHRPEALCPALSRLLGPLRWLLDRQRWAAQIDGVCPSPAPGPTNVSHAPAKPGRGGGNFQLMAMRVIPFGTANTRRQPRREAGARHERKL